MSFRIYLSALSLSVRAIVEEIALRYKIVAVGVDVSTSEVSDDYVALVHNRAIFDPFERVTLDMPFEIRHCEQRSILEAMRVSQSAISAAA